MNNKNDKYSGSKNITKLVNRHSAPQYFRKQITFKLKKVILMSTGTHL